MHDPTVDRTTDGTGRIADLTLGEIRRLSTRGHAPPTLREVLDGLGPEACLQIHVKLEDDEARDPSPVHCAQSNRSRMSVGAPVARSDTIDEWSTEEYISQENHGKRD